MEAAGVRARRRALQRELDALGVSRVRRFWESLAASLLAIGLAVLGDIAGEPVLLLIAVGLLVLAIARWRS